MGSLHRRWHRRLAAYAVALLFLVSALLGCGLTRTVQEGEGGDRRQLGEGNRRGGRRLLMGPGSSPPTCRGRCGGCFPCRPVHVAVQPGRSVPLEYYPEAWRCKCGNKLFMP